MFQGRLYHSQGTDCRRAEAPSPSFPHGNPRRCERMYENFFGLTELPFSLSPDPRFLWLSETHQEGLAALSYGLSSRKGFVLLTGEVGSGKTTLLRSALDRLGDRLPETAMVMNTVGLGALDLLKL